MRKKRGITLVAIIITVVVLLILATVSINLVINGGILNKSKNATNRYSEYEISEQIRLSYLEYENERLYQNNIDALEYIKNSLEKIYGEGTVTKVSLKNNKLKLTIGEKAYQYDIKTGKVGEYVDPIKYGTKTKETIEPGDDITIGTEKFMVFSKSATEIKAMPYYNLVLVTADGTVKQGPAVDGISTRIESKFSSSVYWTQSVDTVDMSDSRNNIQQYITAYRTIFEELGADEIEVRAGKYSEVSAEGVTDYMRNPVQDDRFWLQSVHPLNPEAVWFVEKNGKFGNSWGDMRGSVIGVRPIIIIPID